MRPQAKKSLSGGSSPRKPVSAHDLSMAQLLEAQKTSKSERMGMTPTLTLEKGSDEEIQKLIRTCGEVLDLSDGEGLGPDAFSTLMWALNDAKTEAGWPIKGVVFKYQDHLRPEQREVLVEVLRLEVSFSDTLLSWHLANPLPSNDSPDAPLNGPSVPPGSGPGPGQGEAAQYWSALLKDCRQKFPADQCTLDSPEAMMRIQQEIQDAVASRCSGDDVPPTLDLSGETIDTVAIWVIEAALNHWRECIYAVRLGPLDPLSTEQRVSLLVTCLNSQTLKTNQGSLDLTACSGPRVMGAPDAASGTAAWVFGEADLRAYEQVATGDAQVRLLLKPDAIAHAALPGLRERQAGGRPIEGLPAQQPAPQAEPPQQRAIPTITAEELFTRNPDFRTLYEDVRGRLSQADGATIGRYLEDGPLSAEEWAALKILAQAVAEQARALAYDLPAKPVQTAKKRTLLGDAFDDCFRSFRQKLGQGQYEEALALFDNVVLSQGQMETLETYAARVQRASEVVSDWKPAQPSSLDLQFKRRLWRALETNSPTELQLFLNDAAPSAQQIAQMEQLANELIALGALKPNETDFPNEQFLKIRDGFHRNVKDVNLYVARQWLLDQEGQYRPFSLDDWRKLRGEWPLAGDAENKEWFRRLKVLGHLAGHEATQAKLEREARAERRKSGLKSAGAALDTAQLRALCKDDPAASPDHRLDIDDARRRCVGYGNFLRNQLAERKKQQPTH